MVLKGVEIGEDTVIAAGAVVTQSITAGVLAGGAPAEVIRQLDDKSAHRLGQRDLEKSLKPGHNGSARMC